MEMSNQASKTSGYTELVKAALIGSTVAGILFGIFMQLTGTMAMLASIAGSESLVVGWVMHMIISWTFGLGYGAMTLFSSRYYVLAVIHGVIIWIIGPLLVMPMLMGMGPMFGQMFTSGQLMNLATHVIFSLILAAVFSRIIQK